MIGCLNLKFNRSVQTGISPGVIPYKKMPVRLLSLLVVSSFASAFGAESSLPSFAVAADSSEGMAIFLSMESGARRRDLEAMDFDAYCAWAERMASVLPRLGEKKHEAAVLMCASWRENPHGATMTWNYDDPRVIRVKEAVLKGLAPETNAEVERMLSAYGKLQLARRMASGDFRGEIAFFRPRPAATREQYEEYLAALDAWETAVIDGFSCMKAFDPPSGCLPGEIEVEKRLLYQDATRKAFEKLQRAQLLDLCYSAEQAENLRERGWKAFLAYWRARASQGGMQMTEAQFLELAKEREPGFSREAAVAGMVPLERDILRLWRENRRDSGEK